MNDTVDGINIFVVFAPVFKPYLTRVTIGRPITTPVVLTSMSGVGGYRYRVTVTDCGYARSVVAHAPYRP